MATIDVTLGGCNMRTGSVYMPVHGIDSEAARRSVLGFVRDAHSSFAASHRKDV